MQVEVWVRTDGDGSLGKGDDRKDQGGCFAIRFLTLRTRVACQVGSTRAWGILHSNQGKRVRAERG